MQTETIFSKQSLTSPGIHQEIVARGKEAEQGLNVELPGMKSVVNQEIVFKAGPSFVKMSIDDPQIVIVPS